MHIHANYTAPHHQVIEPRDVRLQVWREDLNYANMMVANSSGAFLHDWQYFEGRPNGISAPPYFVYWNEENRSRPYGHMCFLGLKKLVEPFYNASPIPSGGTITRPISRWLSRCTTRAAR